jgi:hypothetical protein
VAQGLLTHTARPNGGVDPATGRSVDSRYELTAQPWRDRFRAAGRDTTFQKAQVTTALDAFGASARQIQRTMPFVTTERGLVFMLDVANQFGDAGALRLAAQAAHAGMTEPEALAAVEQQSVAAVARQYGSQSPAARSTANRRALVRNTPWLTDAPAVLTETERPPVSGDLHG